MIEIGIRRRIATISHRHSKANNEYMGAECDPTKDSIFISHLVANNIYRWEYTKLSTSAFKRMTDNDLGDWKHLSGILEVDLQHPEDLHDLHKYYPLDPECVKIGNVEKLIQIRTTKPITFCIMKI